METEEKVWEILLSADKKDYERICAEYGITDFRGMLKKLNEMKKEREEEIAEVQNSGIVLFNQKPLQQNCFYSERPILFSLNLLHCILSLDYYYNFRYISAIVCHTYQQFKAY